MNYEYTAKISSVRSLKLKYLRDIQILSLHCLHIRQYIRSEIHKISKLI